MPTEGNRAPLAVQKAVYHAERPDFRITELHIDARQEVPWHLHSHVSDTFYVLQGRLRVFLRDPDEVLELVPGATGVALPRRPHRVTNAGDGMAVFFVLQAGEYDFVPVT